MNKNYNSRENIYSNFSCSFDADQDNKYRYFKKFLQFEDLIFKYTYSSYDSCKDFISIQVL